MQHPSVSKFFQEEIEIYSRDDQAIDSPVLSLLFQWIKSKYFHKNIEICEFGGGAGQLLNKVREQYPGFSYTNAELVGEYKRYQVSNKIKFVTSSILDSGFSDRSFDVLIVRDVLHHLIDSSYNKTRDNQLHALKELKRLVKPGGIIFIDELTNNDELAVRMIYQLTKVNLLLGIRVPFLSINPNICVAFFTPAMLEGISKDVFRDNTIITMEISRIPISLLTRIAHAGGELQRVTLAIEAPI
ncbi:hypothetical protein A2971_01430 [Candidatus Gottesmanbacteria bacterium RIFCSPLOWO2_01_FULL_46_21]|uniref:Uncharacterized protein n=2 Tax=Microgenomates group TaxID=1794810 RepID=A0A0G0WHT0_9BACT|nr:MAG: hypothetical protein UU67_C0053G0006 [Candidatus Daviesbacteria bacterium GW2011_GWB1_41_5]OGG29792.1 MAG: hypothetical protein A2971_01430 [Candidatus Gottesmanbacteria bacterium RIFCSPLOWO2_01_FULL_46_21]